MVVRPTEFARRPHIVNYVIEGMHIMEPVVAVEEYPGPSSRITDSGIIDMVHIAIGDDISCR